jgi:hypothetical protein
MQSPLLLSPQGIRAASGADNLIFNGEFLVAQPRQAPVGSSYYPVDGWYYSNGSTAAHTVTVDSTDAPTVSQSGLFTLNNLRARVSTAKATLGTSDFVGLWQSIEGYFFQEIAQQTFTLSFWVKSTVSGTYCVAFRNAGNDASYVTEYTINAANTWEYKTIVVPPSPATGTWNYTTGRGLNIVWTLANGVTANNTTPGSWVTGNKLSTANQVNHVAALNNDFKLALVKLQPGSMATPFARRSFPRELALAQRYYNAQNIKWGTDKVSLSRADQWFDFPAPMRIAPTVVVNDGTTNGAIMNTSYSTSVSATAFAITTLGFGIVPAVAIANASNLSMWYYASAETP